MRSNYSASKKLGSDQFALPTVNNAQLAGRKVSPILSASKRMMHREYRPHGLSQERDPSDGSLGPITPKDNQLELPVRSLPKNASHAGFATRGADPETAMN